jgi:hypothetical protein
MSRYFKTNALRIFDYLCVMLIQIDYKDRHQIDFIFDGSENYRQTCKQLCSKGKSAVHALPAMPGAVNRIIGEVSIPMKQHYRHGSYHSKVVESPVAPILCSLDRYQYLAWPGKSILYR